MSKIDGREATLSARKYFEEKGAGPFMFEVIEVKLEDDKWRVRCSFYPIGRETYEVFVDAGDGRILEVKKLPQPALHPSPQSLTLGVKQLKEVSGDE